MSADWNLLWIAALMVAVMLALKRLGLVSAAAARAYLKEGALILDVRTTGEFNSRHLPGAINLPLDDLIEGAPRLAPDKSRVLLLHCLSGARSGVARRQLKELGYSRVFNLGSYGRAQRLLENS
jgi:phage shock protein E